MGQNLNKIRGKIDTDICQVIVVLTVLQQEPYLWNIVRLEWYYANMAQRNKVFYGPKQIIAWGKAAKSLSKTKKWAEYMYWWYIHTLFDSQLNAITGITLLWSSQMAWNLMYVLNHHIDPVNVLWIMVSTFSDCKITEPALFNVAEESFKMSHMEIWKDLEKQSFVWYSVPAFVACIRTLISSDNVS